jgi:hypothetical protein
MFSKLIDFLSRKFLASESGKVYIFCLVFFYKSANASEAVVMAAIGGIVTLSTAYLHFNVQDKKDADTPAVPKP